MDNQIKEILQTKQAQQATNVAKIPVIKTVIPKPKFIPSCHPES